MKIHYKNIHCFFMLLILNSFINSSLYAQAGVLDSSFGRNGLVATAGGNIYSSLLLPDGDILATGALYSNPAPSAFCVIRYKSNGTIRKSFGIEGIATVAFDHDAYATSIAIQGNKIVLAGVANNGTRNKFAAVRLNENGSVDSSFGVNGKVITSIGDLDDQCSSMCIQSDGKIILAGYTFVNESNGKTFAALVRYKPNGKLDKTFGSAGIVITQDVPSLANAVSLQADNKILIAGDYTMRFNADGTYDSSFAGTGRVPANYIANAAYIQQDKKILIGGESSGAFRLTRYNEDGSPDNSFGQNGQVQTTFVPGTGNIIYSLALQADNKIIAGGSITGDTHGYNGNFIIARYISSGVLDSSFGDNGKTITDFGGTYSLARCVNLQADGKIILSGFTDSPNKSYFALARYNGDNNLFVKETDATPYNSVVNTTNTTSIKIYPNPANDVINIEGLKATANISIADANGRLIETRKISSYNYTWNVQYLKTGVYYFLLHQKNKITTLKFLKE